MIGTTETEVQTSGVDGLSKEFYMAFWDQVEFFQEQLQEGCLGPGMDWGLMTLLSKKGSREELKNWNPITILNFDYKLLAKVLAKQFKSVLGSIIHENQLYAELGYQIHGALMQLREML
ncbi:hypothetical protein Y1Q_0015460 [Alligator mississippiensis]|uniref:Reverse transcriptase domain-containing protein n=1 Tax=Alligator mississippiensis TaxID=8496 RepID=A0A151ND09_ALLMI|nr:hypothetical protein Y1Q_0015460 [Alligator mississippiensis]